MIIKYTDQALISLNEALSLIKGKTDPKIIVAIANKIFFRCEKLSENPRIGRLEDYLEHIGAGHRRIIEGNFKIIYRIEGKVIYITDIFDTRQDPEKMKS